MQPCDPPPAYSAQAHVGGMPIRLPLVAGAGCARPLPSLVGPRVPPGVGWPRRRVGVDRRGTGGEVGVRVRVRVGREGSQGCTLAQTLPSGLGIGAPRRVRGCESFSHIVRPPWLGIAAPRAMQGNPSEDGLPIQSAGG